MKKSKFNYSKEQELCEEIRQELKMKLEGRTEEVADALIQRERVSHGVALSCITGYRGNDIHRRLNPKTLALHGLQLRRLSIIYEVLGIPETGPLVKKTKEVNSNFTYSP